MRFFLDRRPSRRGSFELVEYRSGLVEIGGVQAFREPGVGLGRQRARLVCLPLARPQATQADRRPELERLRALSPGHRHRLDEGRLRLLLVAASNSARLTPTFSPASRILSQVV